MYRGDILLKEGPWTRMLQRLLGQWKLDEGLSSGRGRICRIDQWNIIL